MTRTEARTNAFMLLFSLYVNDEIVPEDVLSLDEDGTIEIDEFCKRLIDTTRDNMDTIDARIADHLQGWTLERLPKTSLAILRLSAAQLLYMKDIPVKVVINEAVELAKRFGSDNDYVFINGALSSFEKNMSIEEKENHE